MGPVRLRSQPSLAGQGPWPLGPLPPGPQELGRTTPPHTPTLGTLRWGLGELGWKSRAR